MTLRLLIKINLLRYLWSMKKKKGRSTVKAAVGTAGVIALILLVAVLFMGSIAAMAFGFSEAAAEIENGAWFYNVSAAVISFLIMFIGSVFYAVTQVFDSKDNDLLLSMPVRPGDIVLSRLLTVLLIDGIYGWIILLPFFAVGLLTGMIAGPLGAVFYVLAGLFLPLFALGVTCVVAWAVSAASARMKHPKILQTVLLFIMLALYMTVYIGMQNLYRVLTTNAPLLFSIYSKLYPLNFFGDLAQGGVLPLLALIGSSVLAAAIAWKLLDKSFIRVVTASKAGVRRVYRADRVRFTPRSPLASLTMKEMRRFFVTPMYLFNAGFGLLLTVGLSVFLLVKSGDLLTAIAEADMTGLPFPIGPATVTALCSCGLIMMAAMTDISAPSVSLEGRSLWLLRVSPVSGRTVLCSKALSHILLGTAANLPAAILIGVAFRAPLEALLLFVAATVFTVYVACIGVVINCAMPRFDFPSETAVIKQSGAVAVTMLLSMLGGMMITGVGVVAALFIGSVASLLLQIGAGVFLAGIAVLLLLTVSARQFEQFEA